MRNFRPRDFAVAGLSIAAAVALFASFFTTIVYVSVKTASCVDLATPALAADCQKSGGDQHSIAFILLALALLAMAALVLRRRLPLAAWGMIAIGAIALLIALIGDLPDTSASGALKSDFSAAKAHAGTGLWLEIGGGVLAIVAGLVALRRDPDRQLYP